MWMKLIRGVLQIHRRSVWNQCCCFFENWHNDTWSEWWLIIFVFQDKSLYGKILLFMLWTKMLSVSQIVGFLKVYYVKKEFRDQVDYLRGHKSQSFLWNVWGFFCLFVCLFFVCFFFFSSFWWMWLSMPKLPKISSVPSIFCIISRKRWGKSLIFCMKIYIKVFYTSWYRFWCP